jgi:AAHS family 3-hydroxyphenylpropionic acid transporter
MLVAGTKQSMGRQEQKPMTASPSRPVITIALCLLVACFEGIDLQAAGLAVPQVKAEFALAASQLGYFTAASSVGVLFGAIGGGRIADRVGRQRTLTVAIALFGLFSILTAWSGGLAMLVGARFLTGVGLGAALPNLVALANENSQPRWKSRAVAVMYAGFPLGGALASAIMSSVATPGSAINGLLTAWGVAAGDWRAIFYVGGLAPLLAVPLIFFVLPDSIEFAQTRAAQAGATSWFGAVFGEGRAANSVLLWLSFFTTLLVLYLLLNWLPALLNSRGFDRSQAFLVQLAFNGGGIPGSILTGILMDTGRRRFAVPLVYGGVVLLLVLTALMPTDIAIALGCGTVLGAFVMGTQALLYGLAPGCYPTAIRGTGAGAAVCVGRIGSVVGPLVAAGLVGAGRTAPQVLMTLVPLAVVGGLAAVLLSGRVRPAASPVLVGAE